MLDGVRRLPGTIIILADFIPSWLLLLRDRIDSVPFIYVKDECAWFRQSLGMKSSSCHQGSFDSDEWKASWHDSGLPCSVFVQGSVAFCRDMLKSQQVLECESVVAVLAGPVRRLPSSSLSQVKLRHCEVGGVADGLSSIIASHSLLGMVHSEGFKLPWKTRPMHRFLVDSLKVDTYGSPCLEPVSGADPRSWLAPTHLLESLPAPLVFSSKSGWVHRKLSSAELGLAFDLPLECLERFGTAMEMQPSLGPIVASVLPIKVLQAAVSLLWPKSSTTSSPESAPLTTKLRLAVVSLPESAESDLRLAQSKAVKSDDTQTNETLWNTNAAAVPTVIQAWNGVVLGLSQQELTILCSMVRCSMAFARSWLSDLLSMSAQVALLIFLLVTRKMNWLVPLMWL